MKFRNFDYKMFDKAKQIASTSTYDGHSLGCVITYKGHIVSMASNSNKTHPLQRKYNKKYRKFNKSEKPIMDLAHAEILALANIPYPIEQNIRWNEVNVYVYRISPGKRLQMGLARPCAACLAALRDKGIKNLYYSSDDGFIFEEIY